MRVIVEPTCSKVQPQLSTMHEDPGVILRDYLAIQHNTSWIKDGQFVSLSQFPEQLPVLT